MSKTGIQIPGLQFGETGNFLLIAGPCVVESEEVVFETAEHLKKLSEKYMIPFVFKSSYRKAVISVGADGIFIETHPKPAVAKSDGANMLKLSEMEKLLIKLVALRKTINSF